MNDELVIRSQADTAARDAALARLRTQMTISAQIIIDGLVLRREHAELMLKSHTGVESGHILEYPVTWEDLTSALSVDDEDAAVRSEACAAILEWMRDAKVPSSPGFEEFFRWVVFEDLLLDGDRLAVLDASGEPVELPVGWHFEPGSEHGYDYEVRIESRPHLAPLQDRTWMVTRADGWSALMFDSLDWLGSGTNQIEPPEFVTIRPGDTAPAVWFRNEDVVADELIEFNRTFYKYSDRN